MQFQTFSDLQNYWHKPKFLIYDGKEVFNFIQGRKWNKQRNKSKRADISPGPINFSPQISAEEFLEEGRFTRQLIWFI